MCLASLYRPDDPIPLYPVRVPNGVNPPSPHEEEGGRIMLEGLRPSKTLFVKIGNHRLAQGNAAVVAGHQMVSEHTESFSFKSGSSQF